MLILRGGVLYCRVLNGGVVQGEGLFLGNPKDSVWEDWGTLGKPLPLEPLGLRASRIQLIDFPRED